MKQSIFTKFVVPFLQWYLLLIFLTLAIDYILHQLHLVYIGRYLGYIGTAVVIASFVYSLRKRKIIQSGAPKKLLLLHEYMSWIGSLMILVHAGIHFNAVLPWLATFMMLIAVGTGLVGKFLLKKANETLKEKKQYLIETGLKAEDADSQLFWDAVTVDLMKKWRTVHMPITLVLGILVLLHIVSVAMFS